jgi:hypothetical protein
MANIRHSNFVQTHRVYNARSEHQCKLWILGANDVTVYRFVNCNKGTSLVGHVDRVEACMCAQGVQGLSL